MMHCQARVRIGACLAYDLTPTPDRIPHPIQPPSRVVRSLHLAFVLYYDDLEVVNPLGAFHGRHKLGMFYWALVNIEAETRMAFRNLHLMTVALVSDIDHYGIEQIVSGLPGDTSFGSAMTALDEGVHVAQADESELLVRGWCICLSADFPAAALCCGFKKSASASCFCRECYLNQHREGYPSPTSFLEENEDLKCEICLRDEDELAEDYAHFQSLTTATEKNSFLASIGMNTFAGHAFTRVPHFDICTNVPYDFMHVELEGSLKNELAAMLYCFLRKRPGWGFTIDALNDRIRNYPWPGGFSPPTFTKGYLDKGTKSGLPKKGCHVHMTAGDVMLFVRHSIDLLLPLIKDDTDPLWRCWVVHAKYVRLLCQQAITHDELLELDRLIYEHHELFLACKEYGSRLFKPKNHFACHFPVDILNFGPVRQYWCMRFEALNQLFKTFAKTGSFRNTCGRCATFWTIRAAMERSRGEMHAPCATRVMKGLPARTYTRNAERGLAEGSLKEQIVHALFSRIDQQQLAIEWISKLFYAGTEYHAGQSWLSGTLNGNRVLAYIPQDGIFKWSNKFFFYLRLYPVGRPDKYGLPTTEVPEGFMPSCRLVIVGSGKLQDVVPLWPSFQLKRGTSVMYRFV